MAFQSPPIVKLAERMLIEVEQAVRHFSRFHKYRHGDTLRDRAMKVAELAHKAWKERGAIEYVELDQALNAGPFDTDQVIPVSIETSSRGRASA